MGDAEVGVAVVGDAVVGDAEGIVGEAVVGDAEVGEDVGIVGELLVGDAEVGEDVGTVGEPVVGESVGTVGDRVVGESVGTLGEAVGIVGECVGTVGEAVGTVGDAVGTVGECVGTVGARLGARLGDADGVLVGATVAVACATHSADTSSRRRRTRESMVTRVLCLWRPHVSSNVTAPHLLTHSRARYGCTPRSRSTRHAIARSPSPSKNRRAGDLASQSISAPANSMKRSADLRRALAIIFAASACS